MIIYEFFNGCYLSDTIDSFITNTITKTNHVFIYEYGGEMTGLRYEDRVGMKYLSDSLLQNNNRLICFFGGHSKPKINYLPNIDIYYIPTFLLHNTIYSLNQNNVKRIKPQFDKLYYFFNNHSKPHRCMMMDNLVKHGIYDEKSVSWRSPSTDYNFKYWDQKKIIFDFDNNVYLFPNLRDNKTFENMNSLICLCGETMTEIVNDEIFITEKTYRNLIIGQPFLSVGCVNQNNVLKDFGFKLYDNIIDYSFDTMENIDDRCENAIIQIKSLYGRDYNEVYKSIQDVVEHNYNRCIELSRYDPFIPDILLNLYRDNRDIFVKNIPIYLKTIIENNLNNHIGNILVI